MFLLLAVFVLGIIYCLYFDVYRESETGLTKLNSGNLARIPLFWAAFRVSLENPWGIGVGNFNDYAEKFYPQLRNMVGADHVLMTSAHNQFLNILVYYGVLGFGLLVLFYYFIIKGLRHVMESSVEPFYKQQLSAY